MGRGPADTIQTMCEVLGKQTKVIDLTGFYLTKEDVCHLCKAFQRLTNLTKVKLPRTQLNSTLLASIVKSLNQCKSLCLLDVSYNGIYKLKGITKSLVPCLSSLNLSHCNLSSDCFAPLSSLSPNLKTLDISWNRLNELAGMKTLASAFIRRKSSLRELRLAWNSIAGVEAAKVIADLAKNLKNLLFLDLSYNGFSTANEMVPFNDTLLNTTTLRVLLLSGNPINSAAAVALFKDLVWAGQPSLRMIDLGDLWVEKELYLLFKSYQDMFGFETRIGGIKGNVDLTQLDMTLPLMKRIHFLNTPKKKKKKVKDFGIRVSVSWIEAQMRERCLKAFVQGS